MEANRSAPSSRVIPVLAYPDVQEAVDWLGRCLGFVERVRIGPGHRSQLGLGDGALIVRQGVDSAPPDATSVMLRVSDVDDMVAKVSAGGAVVVMPPKEFPYGERQASFTDPWGHRWTVTQTIRDVAPEEWGGTTVEPAAEPS